MASRARIHDLWMSWKSSSLAWRLKLSGALLVLLGLILPLYSCQGRFLDPSGQEVKYLSKEGAAIPEKTIDPRQPLPPGVSRLEPGKPLPPGVTFHKNYHYFFGDFSADDAFDWFRLLGFLWPLGAVLVLDRVQHRWIQRIFRWLEPLLVAQAALALSSSAIFGAKESGFWTAWSGIILYSLGAARADCAALGVWKPDLRSGWRRFWNLLLYLVFLAASAGTVLSFFKWFVKG